MRFFNQKQIPPTKKEAANLIVSSLRGILTATTSTSQVLNAENLLLRSNLESKTTTRCHPQLNLCGVIDALLLNAEVTCKHV